MIAHILQVLISGTAVIFIFGFFVIKAIKWHDAEQTKRAQYFLKKLREKEGGR